MFTPKSKIFPQPSVVATKTSLGVLEVLRLVLRPFLRSLASVSTLRYKSLEEISETGQAGPGGLF